MKVALLVKVDELNGIRETLVKRGFEVEALDTVEKMNEKLINGGIDLAIVDIDLLAVDIWLLRKFKDILIESCAPIIVIVSKKNIFLLVEDFWFTDFLVSPFSGEELLVRVMKVLRVKENNIEEKKIIKHGSLIIDTERCKVTLRGKEISLTFKEYELLKLLVSNKGRVFRREELLAKLWGYDYYGGDRTVDTHISRLRNKLGDYDHRYIQTVRNIGYKFSEEDCE